jgi:hypothetical protein
LRERKGTERKGERKERNGTELIDFEAEREAERGHS